MNTRVAILTAVLALVSSVHAANPPRKSENDRASISTAAPLPRRSTKVSPTDDGDHRPPHAGTSHDYG